MDNNLFWVIGMVVCLAIGFVSAITILQLLSNEETNIVEDNLIEMSLKEREIKTVALDCYWAVEYLTDPEGTIEHFQGKDYSNEYIYDCLTQGRKNWELIKNK